MAHPPRNEASTRSASSETNQALFAVAVGLCCQSLLLLTIGSIVGSDRTSDRIILWMVAHTLFRVSRILVKPLVSPRALPPRPQEKASYTKSLVVQIGAALVAIASYFLTLGGVFPPLLSDLVSSVLPSCPYPLTESRFFFLSILSRNCLQGSWQHC